jgi:glyoxylase-like metal-dependent hydrolase (beta-lactamase superfamily II)
MYHIKNDIYCIEGATNIGIIRGTGKTIVIDTGIDESSAKRIAKEVSPPMEIVNTHSHADHCGGNSWLQANRNAKVYAPEIESELIKRPDLEPLYFFSGAKPIKELDNKFLKAAPSRISGNPSELEGILIHPLYGHTPGQIGIECDNVLFSADSFFPKEVIEKHKILYHTDINESIRTLNWLNESNFDFYVPSHGSIVTDAKEIVDINLDSINSVSERMLGILKKEMTTEEVSKYVCDSFGINMTNPQQFYLMNTVIMAYLSYLKSKNEITYEIKSNRFYWKKDALR